MRRGEAGLVFGDCVASRDRLKRSQVIRDDYFRGVSVAYVSHGQAYIEMIILPSDRVAHHLEFRRVWRGRFVHKDVDHIKSVPDLFVVCLYCDPVSAVFQVLRVPVEGHRRTFGVAR